MRGKTELDKVILREILQSAGDDASISINDRNKHVKDLASLTGKGSFFTEFDV